MNKPAISVLSFLLYLTFTPIAIATEMLAQPKLTHHDPSPEIVRRGGGGGARRSGGSARRSGGGSRSFNRSSMGSKGSGRIQRSGGRQVQRSGGSRGSRQKISNNRGNLNLNGDRNRSNRVKPNRGNRIGSGNRANAGNRIGSGNRANAGQRIERPNRGDRINSGNRNVNRNRIDNRDINLSNDRHFSNRVDRSRTNVGNRVNIGNRNVVVNPRGGGYGGAWGWNRGVAWYPTTSYWGGGFWGAFAIGGITGGLIGAATASGDSSESNTYIENNYYTVEEGTPGYTLLDDYGLTQTPCGSANLVVILGPENSNICALPNDIVPAGNYEVDTTTLTLVAVEY